MTMALAEVFHAAARFVKSDPITTTMQVLSRLHVVYIIWGLVEESHAYKSTYVVCAAWALSEMIRYPFYLLQLVSKDVPMAVKWMRYSAFLVLYPIGIAGEMICMGKALRVFGAHVEFQRWPTPMPNRMNFEMSLKFVYQVVLLGYVPGGYHMYTHMMVQRKRALDKVSKRA
eukprot:Blabericola_migrator_1__2647@NODE_1750_length_3862_cov_96_765481_g1127_i0_p3_GENE_NODE_1750_length_3862_cov_96_765481_g1127_i0NODE_1750_length_3862_cov_96_765481_g1127_i0_p3_ORF_typecomplete_len172_score20_55PTPLA/PF04387_14/1_9e49Monooxygenase_B/PF04744_12/0_049_NODE_1750_length_3862_cov_96_765481_g1127_i0145660